MSERSYDVVAMSFPIVYTIDGDHDPNGMLFTLRSYEPLLRWARAQWEDHDEFLPRLHRRCQLIQLVVDGLERYQQMRITLGRGDDHHLLHDVGSAAQVLAREEDDASGPQRDARGRAIRQNYRATVDELVLALGELTRGQVTELTEDLDQLQRWSREWGVALRSAEQAIRNRLVSLNERFDADALTKDSDLTADDARRLLLNDHSFDVAALGEAAPPYDWFNPVKPLPVVRPLVLRACAGDTVTVLLENQIAQRRVGLHLQGEGLVGGEHPLGTSGTGIGYCDGAYVGANPDSTVGSGQQGKYVWNCLHEGVWTINDLADIRGTERGTNAHGLFGALVVEPTGSRWRDPETGEDVTDTDHGDGLYLDVLAAAEREFAPGEAVAGDDSCTDGCTPEAPCAARHHAFVDFSTDPEVARSFREFTVFFHDEPEVHGVTHLVGEHTVMPLSYRAEPMPNRLPHRMRRLAAATPDEPAPGQVGIDFSAVKVTLDTELGEVFWTARTPEGEFLERVAGEEQHHSSWLFGEPATPVLRAYRGDPARIRLVHAGVKEAHVFHLHVHQWRAVPQDTAEPSTWRPGAPRGSQLLDSITIGPQTAVTIDPLYGSGSRQHAVGDIIWHCHLYPHFHHGMWGLWRSFDRYVDGGRAYPDGTPCPPLCPLPGREPPPSTPEQPGFPWFIDATFPRKSPPPPAIRAEDVGGRRTLLRMPLHSDSEWNAFDPGCRADPQPGALFVHLDGLARRWNTAAGLPEQRIISYDVTAVADRVEYNSRGWHDVRGHRYRLTGVQVTTLGPDGKPAASTRCEPPAPRTEPFFPRANHGDVVELRFHNLLTAYPADDFDLGALPVECGLHVHLVKFDVLAADGSATGWNYLSGASCTDAVGPNRAGEPPRNVSLHRWVVDEEFGPCFFHDHLLANYRQKHGLFAALIAEPQLSRWYLPDQRTPAWSGPQAVVIPPDTSDLPPYREACLAIGDFIPLYREGGAPLNPPHALGADDDPGAMGVNYRNAPLTFRGDDPSEWFSSTRSSSDGEGADEEPVAGPLDIAEPPAPVGVLERGRHDPDTELVGTYPGERLRIRLIQGSHEEQHSFVAHGLRWRKEWHNRRSPLVNQQTLGISEVFTLDIDPADSSTYGLGDHLWKFSAMDDLWLGCWGLIRALQPSDAAFAQLPPLAWARPDPSRSPREVVEGIWAAGALPPRPTPRAGEDHDPAEVQQYVVTARRTEHRYSGAALTDPWGLVYEVADGWDDAPTDGRTGHRRATGIHHTGEPLVLRARSGQWVRIVLINEVFLPEAEEPVRGSDEFADPRLPDFGVEVSPPRLPIEHLDELGYPDRRRVSPRVSLHPSLLRYDVVSDDGANVGRNHDGTVAALDPPGGGHDIHADTGTVILRTDHSIGHRDQNWREYWWYADPALAPHGEDGAGRRTAPLGQVCYLHDMGDIRNHRHHGLIGALVVEPEGWTAEGLDPATNEVRTVRVDGEDTPVRWGTRARLTSDAGDTVEEIVVFLQDGLRHFVAGDIDLPLRDVVPGDDPEDAGQKAINYRSTLLGQLGLRADEPVRPGFTVAPGDEVWLRLVCAADKPRNHTFTMHGLAWPAAPWLVDGPWTGSASGLTADSVHDVRLTAGEAGDYAYRSGVFKWAVGQGMWSVLRVAPDRGRAAGPRPPSGTRETGVMPGEPA
ncbi:multicopper oxidase domain-containing protein [Geodermatophilus sp. URMC 62]|uniref:multicopper oxidase domain-containing protein n=1 Tax=Geodermatophilus sp. URMC 62 TaxID=3423414 RepID=UPI00406CD29B